MTSSHPDLGSWLAALPTGRRRGGPRRICIATTDVPGPLRGGGIGAAYLHLAEALVRAGHHVTLLYVEDGFESGDRHAWERHYSDLGLELVHVPGRPARDRHYYEDRVETSFATWQWLRSRDFDLIHFHERLGIGFHCVHAKRLGMAFAETTLVVMLHGCVRWGETGNETPLTEPYFFEIDHLERESARLADVVISPTRYMLDWVRGQGWELPAASFVQPLVCGRFEAPAGAMAQPVEEIVFFGRLEPRKGIRVFCDAIDRLGRATARPFRVGFLGKGHWIDGAPSADYIAARAAGWGRPVAVHSDWDTREALLHLGDSARLAVIPSAWDNMPLTVLECIGAGVPFLAAATGGIPEEIHADDRARVLFELSPEALAEKLAAALEHGAGPARLGFDSDANEATWVAWHGAVEAPPAAAKHATAPSASVCPLLPGADAASLDRTVALAGAEFLLFLAPGHEALPGALERLERAAAATESNLYVGGLEHREPGTPDDPEGPLLGRILPLGSAPVVGFAHDCFAAGAVLVRRSWLQKRGGFPGIPGVDPMRLLLTQAALEGERIAVVPDVLASRRVLPDAAPPPSDAPSYVAGLALVEAYRSALPRPLADLATWLHALLPRTDAMPRPLPTGPPPSVDPEREHLLARFDAAEGGQDFRHPWNELLEARFHLVGGAAEAGLALQVYDRIGGHRVVTHVLQSGAPAPEARCVTLRFRATPFQQLEFRAAGDTPAAISHVEIVRPARGPRPPSS